VTASRTLSSRKGGQGADGAIVGGQEEDFVDFELELRRK
jgi:hypothetical protein